MTAALQATPSSVDSVPTERLASWPARAGAFALDVLPAVAVIATMALLALAAPRGGWLWWVFTVTAALTFVAAAVNRLVSPAINGWSLGRAVFGVRVVCRDGGRAGMWRLLARDAAHLLDTGALFIGWLWPLWDGRHRTFADMLTGTEARAARRPQREVRPLAAVILLVAVLLCGAATGMSYLVVYRHDRAVDHAREQITEQGPRIVEQLLSFRVDTMQQDFAKAQSLATDSYRVQLTAQQQAVQRAGPTANEYWAVSSAVLSAVPDRASMLLALQGQRGADAKDLKFITATVRADFDRSRDGQWRVANLTVLKKPQMNGAGQ